MEKFLKFLNVIKKDICSITHYKTRSRRNEYFYWYLASVLASFIIDIIVGFIMEFLSILGEIILSIFIIFIFFVSLPLGIRRLHDIGKKCMVYPHWIDSNCWPNYFISLFLQRFS